MHGTRFSTSRKLFLEHSSEYRSRHAVKALHINHLQNNTTLRQIHSIRKLHFDGDD